jgi:hypothetical protein
MTRGKMMKVADRKRPSMTQFEREKYWVTRFLELLQFGPCELDDPNALYHEETGADVLMKLDSRQIGIQVTELDAGADNPFSTAGKLRADEKEGEASSSSRASERI